MPISVITNFSINDSVPFDTRLVATSSISMDNMLYKYVGLTTYRSDLGLNYTYNGSTWAVSSNGIYGGSGNLGTSSTIINFGTVSAAISPAPNSDSNKLTFRSYSGSPGELTNSVRVENYFIRHSSNFFGISYKNQLILSESNGQGLHNGPYIMYNPKPLFNGGIGGISFGVLAGTLDQEITPSYERMRIDASGIIRFKPNTTVNDATRSVNIGIDSTDTRPFIGFNWNGSTVDDGTDASYVQFNNSVFSIHHFLGDSSTGTGTHSAIFSRSGVSINGTFSTNRSISFGAADGGVYFVSSNGNGMKYDSGGQGYAALTYRTGTTQIKDILKWNSTDITLQTNTSTTQSVTFTTYGPFNARNSTNIWDNKFYNLGSYRASTLSVDSNRQSGTSNTVIVSIVADGEKTYRDFVFNIKATYNAATGGSPAKRSFILTTATYDRYIYLFNDKDGTNADINHKIELFLYNEEPIPAPALQNSDDFIKIGQINFNGSNYYSNSFIIPANTLFKIRFIFPDNYDGVTNSDNYVRSMIIRSGKYPLSSTGGDGVDDGGGGVAVVG